MLTVMKDITGLLHFVGFCPYFLQRGKSYFFLSAEGNLRVAAKVKSKVS